MPGRPSPRFYNNLRILYTVGGREGNVKGTHPVDKSELNVLYKQAIHLVKVGKYGEGLSILTDIDRERPNVKGVLYPMAVCLEMTGRFEEALELCDRLVTEFDEPKGAVVKARIQKTMEDGDLPMVDLVSDLDSRDTPKPAESPVLGGGGPVPPVAPSGASSGDPASGSGDKAKKSGLFARLFKK